MSINAGYPDYELPDRLDVTTPTQLRALSDQLRVTIVDMLLERAATVAELAAALGRPKSTVAHHVNVLLNAGLLRVVRTRRVRAIDERFYGRTARMFYLGVVRQPGDTRHAGVDQRPRRGRGRGRSGPRGRPTPHDGPPCPDPARTGGGVLGARGGRWAGSSPSCHREGDTVFGLAVGLYPTDHPSLPEPT